MKDFNYKYTIRDFIDKTKWSNVYSGINKETNEKIIINILINVEDNEENLEIFKEEIDLLKSINSTNVISINHMDTYRNKDKTYYYIESEDFEGLTLEELMRINKLHNNQCLQIIREVINGVKEFNNKKINFGNLTRENIIINGKGIIKIDMLSFINNHKGHINCKIHDTKKFRAHEDVQAIGSILCQMITDKEIFNPEENKKLDKDISEILAKATNKKHTSKHKYKDLNEFLNDIDLYLCGEKLSNNSEVNLGKYNELYSSYNIKKYVVIACSVVILLCTTAFGAQYIMNKKSDNMATTNTSEDVYEEENSEDKKELNLTPIEENMIKTKDSAETTKKEETSDNNNKSNENTKEEDKNENISNKDKNKEDKDKDKTDKEDPDKDNSDKDNNKDDSDKDNSDEDNNKEDPDKDNNDEDKEKPDDDNSNEEKPDQNPDEDQNSDKNSDVVE